MEMGFEKEDSMNALETSDWDATRAVEILCDKKEFSRTSNIVAQNVLESPAVQNYLTDPEIFMSKSRSIFTNFGCISVLYL